jgi:hypothetical protein
LFRGFEVDPAVEEPYPSYGRGFMKILIIVFVE